MILRALVAFAALFVLDIVWARYTAAVIDRRRTLASSHAVAIFGLGAIGTISYIDDPRMIVPAMLGAFCGTFVGTKRNPSTGVDQ
jgi:hypothetical protein